MQPSISVIVCTHNPRQLYLDRVLGSLAVQTLTTTEWEVLLIDNASEQMLASTVDLTWHPNSYCIREDTLGLTPARLRGIQEANTDILVFVDDDNVLSSDYLENALRISKNYPFIGVWGGQIRGEYEIMPPFWSTPYLHLLGIREFDEDRWSNLISHNDTTPCGAGMCLRRSVALAYKNLVEKSEQRRALGRTGTTLTSGEDSDLAYTACDLGMGKGLFASLKLIHLIPAKRLEQAYFIKLIEEMYYSHTILASFRGQLPEKEILNWRSKIKASIAYFRMNSMERAMQEASRRGAERAIKVLSTTNERN